MRLVDADDFIVGLEKYIDKPMTAGLCATLIELQPTAYDIDRVVAELKEWSFNADVNLGDGTVKNSDLIASENAIEIVKRGIISDDECKWYKIKSNAYKSNTHAELYDSRVMDWDRCPYCNKKVKVVE